MGSLNEGAGVSYIFYDREYSILLVAGRGDNVLGIYHFDKSSANFLKEVQ